MYSDVTSFLFHTSQVSYAIGGLDSGSFPIPISTTGAAPYVNNHKYIYIKTYEESLDIEFNANWNQAFGQIWVEISGDHGTEGAGHWSITGATTAVPEPSTAVVAVFGAVSGIAYGFGRKRRAQRRQGAGGQPQLTA
jgi:hypothetical protein